MNTLRLLRGLTACFCLFAAALVAAPKDADKSPGDIAYDALRKLYDDREAASNQERVNQLSKAGLDFVQAHPRHKEINRVIDYMIQLKDQFKSKPALRGIFYSQVQSALLTPLFDDKTPAEVRPVLLALDTGMSEGMFRYANANKDTFASWQDKILAQLKEPSHENLLRNRAAAFYEAAAQITPRDAPRFLDEVLEVKDRATLNWARAMKRFSEMRAAPFELKFTAIDGKPVDVSAHQGKLVCLVFWSATYEKLPQDLEKLAENINLIGGKQCPVVMINIDAEQEREAVLAAIKNSATPRPAKRICRARFFCA
ncbi:MAG: redoxin domain-containing protein [Opitutaceae bacterium]|nr:redoxin domain-containing protein [Opitutaceae bacterium]